MTINAAINLAMEHFRADRLEDAEKLCRKIIDVQPRHAQALYLLGVIVAQFGEVEDAIRFLRGSIFADPANSQVHTDLSVIHMQRGDVASAIRVLEEAIASGVQCPELLYNLGNCYGKSGRISSAIDAYRRATGLRPEYAEAHHQMAVALLQTGDLTAAEVAIRQALQHRPNSAEMHSNLGLILRRQKRYDEALAECKRAIEIDPNLSAAYNNLGAVYSDQFQTEQAIEAYQQVIALCPDDAAAHNNLGHSLKDQGRLDEAIQKYQRSLELEPHNAEIHSNLIYATLFHPDYDLPALVGEIRRWSQRFASPLKSQILPHTNDRSPERRLRVGYVSPDFRSHPIAQFMLPLLAHHNKRVVEVFCYAHVAKPDEITGQLRSHADTWRSTVSMDDAQLAEAIRRDKIDILVDLTMHMAYHRLLTFARKPAPVQITYLAYCCTTGLDTIDYRLSDPHLDPPGGADEKLYTETTLRLPESYWCYSTPVGAGEVGDPPSRNSRVVTFGCLNNFCKTNPRVLETWSQILLANPQSRLLLHAQTGGHRKQVIDSLGARGIDASRIEFAASVPRPDYFNLYNKIDIALDPFPYGGGTTTCDALWMGVPVITLRGKTALGRSGVSILSNLQLPELIADTEQDYIRLAGALARDPARLMRLRHEMRDRMTRSPLMNGPRFAQSIEAIYRQIWRKWCQNPPRPALA